MTNNTNTPTPSLSTMTRAERDAYFSAARPTITMPSRPTDTSRNGMRAPRSVPRRAIR